MSLDQEYILECFYKDNFQQQLAYVETLLKKQNPTLPRFVIRAGATGSGKGQTEKDVLQYLNLDFQETVIIDVDDLMSKTTSYETEVKTVLNHKAATQLYFRHRKLADLWSEYLLHHATAQRTNIVLETQGLAQSHTWLLARSQELRFNGYEIILVYVYACHKTLSLHLEQRNKKQIRQIDIKTALKASTQIYSTIHQLAAGMDRLILVDTSRNVKDLTKPPKYSCFGRIVGDLRICCPMLNKFTWPELWKEALKDYIQERLCTVCAISPGSQLAPISPSWK